MTNQPMNPYRAKAAADRKNFRFWLAVAAAGVAFKVLTALNVPDGTTLDNIASAAPWHAATLALTGFLDVLGFGGMLMSKPEWFRR
jgi:hypothetical protein